MNIEKSKDESHTESIDPWENISLNLSKVLEDDVPNMPTFNQSLEKDSVVIRQRPQITNGEIMKLNTQMDLIPAEYSSRTMLGDLTKNLSRYVLPDKNETSVSPPPGLGPIPSPTKSSVTNQDIPFIDSDGSCNMRYPDIRTSQMYKMDKNRHSIASVNEFTNPKDFEIFPINENIPTNNQRSPMVQIDHLMHLLSERLCSLEETTSTVDKKLDMYEFHCRKKLEDCREHLRKRIDELVEEYDINIGLTVKTRRKSLQVLERSVENHLTDTQRILTKTKLKLSRMKITNEELHGFNDLLLDYLIKTKKIQRDSNEFNYWLDFTPKDPLEMDNCIGSLQYTEHEEPHLPIDLKDNRKSVLNPYAENWEPRKSILRSAFSRHLPQEANRNYSIDDSDYLLGKNNVQYRRSVGPSNIISSVNVERLPSKSIFVNRRNSWHPMMQESVKTMDMINSFTNEHVVEDLNGSHKWTNCAPPKMFNQRIPYKNCIQLLPTAPTLRHVLDKSFLRGKHCLPVDRMSFAGSAASSLLTLDMQRPIVVDCYGDPPRHLKCIKELCFMSDRLLICENGRRNGHKNVLMFSLTGSFLSIINPPSSPFTNPTGICVMENSVGESIGSKEDVGVEQKIIVADGTNLKIVCSSTGQLISTYDLELQNDQANLKNSFDENLTELQRLDTSELSTFHRQDRFGGLSAVDNLVYICDRKTPSMKVFDIRQSRIVSEWTSSELQNPNFIFRKKEVIYVSDSASNKVVILNPNDGSSIGELRSSSKNLFNNPCGICDDGDNLAIADLYNNRIQLFSKDCLIGSIYSPCIESPFSIAYHPMGVMAISNGRPRTVTLYFTMLS